MASLRIKSLLQLDFLLKEGFIDFLLGDGLYATREFFSICLEKLGCHGGVKIEERSLLVVDFAEGLFNAYPGGDEYITLQ